MAFRIHEAVQRGEIDNRDKGTVRGKIWLAGRAAPLVLQLSGNAHPDLAGCVLTFQNPAPAVHDPREAALHPLQLGTAGDLTASRKVRVFDVPLVEALAMIQRGEKPPEHMANGLYLEWFSAANGRVVIESTNFQLNISPSSWRMTPEEDEQRARHAAVGLAGFLAQLAEAVEGGRFREEPLDPDVASADAAEDLVLRENEDLSAPPADALDEGGEPGAVPKLDSICASLLFPQRANHRRVHPLARRCVGSAARCRERAALLGWPPLRNPDLDRFLDEFRAAAEKLMSAPLPPSLGGDQRSTDATRPPTGTTLETELNHVLEHLRAAQAALARVAPTRFLPEDFIADGRRELIEVHLGVLALIIAHGRPT